MKKEKSILVVLGMHRSGTSVTTRLFNLLGADSGENLMVPAEDNPTGFWEPADIVAVHDEILKYLGYTWDDPRPLPYKWWARPDMNDFVVRLCQLAEQHYSDITQPIIKDPRLCRLLPIWQKVFKKLGWAPHYILVGRSPLEVAASLAKRNNLTSNHSYLLWMRHVIESEKWSRGSPRTFLLYEQLFDNWEAEIRRCRSELGLNSLDISELQKSEIIDLIDVNLRHNQSTEEAIDATPELLLFVADIFHGFQQVVTDRLTRNDMQIQFDLIGEKLAAADNLYSSIWLPCQNQRDSAFASVAEYKQKDDLMRADLEHYRGLAFVHQKQHEEIFSKLELQAAEIGHAEALREEHTAIRGELEQRIEEKNNRIDALNLLLLEADGQLTDIKVQIDGVEKYTRHLESEISKKNIYIHSLENQVGEVKSSTSWKMTLPFRLVGNLVRRILNYFSRSALSVAHVFINKIPIKEHAKYSLKRWILINIGRYFIWMPPIRSLYAQHSKPYVYIESDDPEDIKISLLVNKIKDERGFSVDKKDYDQYCENIFDDFLCLDTQLVFPSFDRIDVSIALIFYNRAELSFACLMSIREAGINNYELIIVDNDSSDRTSLLLDKLSNVKLIKNDENKGFVKACNQAAREASGDYLLLLNNDTLLVPGSIESSLNIVKNNPDVGAVGARIINLDGKLQEAGSYMFRDGGCAGYGRGESPYLPEFMYQRSVDYCSGAYLMTPMKLFNKLGGLDEDYSPAYYEESDYCVRLIKDNKKIIYDPDSVIIHYEFASSGTIHDAIELQRKNRGLFVSKHDDFLSSKANGESHNKYVSRSNEKPINRILFIDDRVPHMYYGSGFPRSNKIVNFLDELGYFVTVYPLRFPYEEKSWGMLYEDISKNIEVMRNNGADELPLFLKDRKGYYDVIFVSRPHNMELINEYIEEGFLTGNELIIYDAEALFSLRDIVEKKLKGVMLSDKEQKKMIDDEMSIAKNAEKIITVSNQEREVYVNAGFDKVHVLGHGVTINPTLEKFNSRKDILFVGAIHACHSPNADSVLWFVEEVFPIIRKAIPGIRLNVVGFNLCEKVDSLMSEDILIYGQVEDLTGFYNDNRVFIAPTRYAAGIPMKVHHAAGYGLPCVVTEILRDQLGWEDGVSVMSANPDSPDLFAEKCIDLYSNQGMWETIREGALCKIEEECSDETFKSNLNLALET